MNEFANFAIRMRKYLNELRCVLKLEN